MLFIISNFYIDVFLSIKFSNICNFEGSGQRFLIFQEGINVKYGPGHSHDYTDHFCTWQFATTSLLCNNIKDKKNSIYAGG